MAARTHGVEVMERALILFNAFPHGTFPSFDESKTNLINFIWKRSFANIT